MPPPASNRIPMTAEFHDRPPGFDAFLWSIFHADWSIFRTNDGKAQECLIHLAGVHEAFAFARRVFRSTGGRTANCTSASASRGNAENSSDVLVKHRAGSCSGPG
jgi:hypothetical protein